MSDTDTAVLERTEEKTEDQIAEPKRYKVILHNDNVTTIEFVIALLIKVFRKNQRDAVAITMDVHHNGKGVAGIYSHEIAEQKAAEGLAFARKSNYPLRITVEEEK